MLSTDATILREGSPAAERMRAYGDQIGSLTVLVAGRGSFQHREYGSTNILFPGGRSKMHNFFRMWYYARAIDADVISAQDPLWTGLIAIWSNKKAVQIQAHTDTFGALGHVLVPYVLRRASCVRAVSEAVKHVVQPYTHAPVAVLPIFVDVRAHHTELPEPIAFKNKTQRIIVVSRLAPEKRVELAINAIQHVTHADLYIIGDGPLRRTLEDLARALRVSERVHFLGWQEDVRPYYQHADALLLPSQFEGYGMVLVEAALAGCPIVSTNVGIAATLPTDIVTLVEGDQYHIADALRDALTDERKQRARAARDEFAQHMPDLSTYLAQYVHLLETCGI